jgi:Secretion system C-terminal sorting domain
MKRILALFVIVLISHKAMAQNTITTDTILQLSTCAGGNVIVPFSTTGSFGAGCVYTAELSNAFGQFTTPIAIGSSPFNLGFIFATIPANTNFGIFYKIRVVSSNPAVIGDPCPNTLIVTQVAQLNQIIATPDDTVCNGEVVTLTALNPANSYSWSTGDTSNQITATQGGTYSVTTLDFLGCESTATIDIVYQSCLGLEEKVEKPSFNLSPNPSNGKVSILDVSDHFGKYDIEIINLLGQKVYTKLGNSNQTTVQIDLSDLRNGVYFVQISSGKEKLQRKLILQ